MLVPPGRPPTAVAQSETAPPPSGAVIVVLEESASTDAVTAASEVSGVEPDAVFTEVFDGFAATVTQAEADALADDPQVAAIYPSERFWQAEQILPTGVDRIDADQNPSADIDGSDDTRVNADVAVLDTGISLSTGDLVVPGGINCANDGISPYDDGTGHGTHVAGIVGALDNGTGVVGVAPGARMWSVRVLNRFGGGSSASLICGLDWAARRSSTIDVVNMSIEGPGTDGDCESSALHLAICGVVIDAGIPVIVAAGNGSDDASRWIPAAYEEVIAVSSLSDSDGAPGGDGPAPGCSPANGDDLLATTSNFGPDIDIAAPGVCIRSLTRDGGTVLKSGTSMAAPHVVGAAALYLAVNPGATPAQVKSWLVGNGKAQSSAEGFGGDQDSSAEPLVWLGGGAVTAQPTEIPEGAWPLVRSGASVNSVASTYVRDGKLSTVWRTNPFRDGPPDEAWVWVDLGSRKPVGSIRWVFGQAGIGDYFEIEGSNNLLTWQYITRRNGKPVGLWQEKTLSRNYRYIRFRFENPNRDTILGGLAEIQVYPPGIEPPSPPPATQYDLKSSADSVNTSASYYVRDGEMSPVWKSKRFQAGPPDEAWVWVDLGSSRPIGTVRWVFGEYGIGDYFEIEGSNDAQSWSYITKRNGKPVGVWQEKELARSYRYVRFRFENPNRDLYLGGLAEVEVWSPGETPPLGSTELAAESASTPVSTATTEPDGPYPLYGSGRSSNSTLPREVWDGDPGTIWRTDGTSTPESGFVYVTLGEVKPIGAVRWLYGIGEIGDELTIQVSDDRLTWTDVHTAGNAPVGEWQLATFSGLEAKYVRWYFANPNGDPVIGGLAEIEIYPPGIYEAAEQTATPAPTETATATPTATVDTDSPQPVATETTIVTETATDLATPIDAEPEQPVAESPTTEATAIGEEPTETATEPAPTETATEVPSGPTPYLVVETSRSASTVPGTTAIDGDPATIWQTAPGEDPGRIAILTLELDYEQPVGQVRLLPGPDGLSGAATIETSNDGETWSYYAELDLTVADAEGWIVVNPAPDVSAPVSAQFVRIVFVNQNGSPVLGNIAEIELLPPSL